KGILAMSSSLSPMMTQYLLTKEQYKDCILFYRLGDFYEMFFDDALVASKAIGLTLTGRDCGLPQRAPMCGIPYHAADTYIAKLIEQGFKVAICEQLTAPEKGKKLVERDVVRIITAGTVTNDNMLDEKNNNFIASVFGNSVSWVDITAGNFYAIETDDTQSVLSMVQPSEVITKDNCMYPYIFEAANCKKALLSHFNVTSLNVFDINENSKIVISSGALLQYITNTQKKALCNLTKIEVIKNGNLMFLDANTRRNLELTQNVKDGKRKNTLLAVLDKTSSVLGARALKNIINQPLIVKEQIEERLCAVEELVNNNNLLNGLKSNLEKISDIERLCGKIANENITPRECLGLLSSIYIIEQLNQFCCKALPQSAFYDFTQLKNIIEASISPDCPNNLKDGGYIKKGYNSQLDELQEMSNGGRLWLAKLEAAERDETKIKNLKIGFNKIFGYYFEVLTSQLNLVPYRWVRKQTVAGGERFVSEELKTIEEKILTSGEKAIALEIKLFAQVKENLKNFIKPLLNIARAISFADCMQSFATVAITNNYVRPEINTDGVIDITNGRHPVVEQVLNDGAYINNNCLLNNKENKTIILTGPNMAGKSTFMRQVALIVLMAQIGSFVPADRANINLTDRIFTRIGASDDLSTGQSTFMVEINEVANIINNATYNSLLILDEIGRGTSTYDGLSIAWSVLEYINQTIGAKCLFATHFHELTKLEGSLLGIKNYKMLVKEFDNNVIFLRKVVEGAAERSFGIEVAKMCGLPKSIIEKATSILNSLESKKEKK
ncbi:MAG: DNA mismatch repair protein MutS, partial [Firmicutes bacterium]|nr:DNA mismatch repair protein MutS [Bacillota bacterium]